jgi:hypothetical protein
MMNDKEFSKLVNDDIRDDVSKQDAAWLRSDDVISRWINELTCIKMSVERQLSLHKSERAKNRATIDNSEEYVQYLAEAEKWRAGVIRFKTGVDLRLMEAKFLYRNGNNKYRAAIVEHQRTIENDAEFSEIADMTLWSVL